MLSKDLKMLKFLGGEEFMFFNIGEIEIIWVGVFDLWHIDFSL